MDLRDKTITAAGTLGLLFRVYTVEVGVPPDLQSTKVPVSEPESNKVNLSKMFFSVAPGSTWRAK